MKGVCQIRAVAGTSTRWCPKEALSTTTLGVQRTQKAGLAPCFVPSISLRCVCVCVRARFIFIVVIV